MFNFALGAAAIVAPAYGIPAVVGFICGQGVQELRRRRKNKQSNSAAQNGQKASADAGLLDATVPPVVLEWNGVNCTLKSDKKAGTTKVVLDNISGVARPGRLTAIMGPSGSGKTSLLNALAGQVPLNKHMALSGSVTINGVPSTASNHRQAYVQQEDAFYSMLTAEETLEMASQLRLPSSLPEDQRAAYVERLVATLGLTRCIGTVVGDKKKRGLSGGEKKRLSIGCELIGSPSLLFLDEPTTGLDAFAAEKVVSTLKHLAGSGHTVVASIHQPRSSIFALFDELVLLSEGQLLYCGPAQQAVQYFTGLGHACPPGHSPADFLADLISVDYSTQELEEASRLRVTSLAAAWSTSQQQRPPSRVHPSPSLDLALVSENTAPRVGWLRQLGLLARRSWRQITRDRATNISRAMANISSALIFGCIFFRLKRNQSSVQDRLGLLQVAAINTAMSSLVKTLNVFPKERVIMTREKAKRSYGTAPYLAAKLLAELPVSAAFPLLFGSLTYPLTGLNPRPARFLKFLSILTLESFTSAALGLTVGAFAPSTEAAMAIGPAVMVVFIVFGGYYVNAESVPRVLRWLPHASLIKQSFEALCVNEFPGLEFEAGPGGQGMRSGEQVLSWLSFDRSSIPKCALGQARILLFYYWATYSILKSKRNAFMTMAPPLPPAAAAGAEASVKPPATPTHTPTRNGPATQTSVSPSSAASTPAITAPAAPAATTTAAGAAAAAAAAGPTK